MPRVQCHCGTEYDITSEYYNQSSPCATCNRLLRFVVVHADSGDQSGDIAVAIDFAASLIIRAGPERVGEQIFLAGDGRVTIGKLPQHPICLTGLTVSRHHCTLFPSDGGIWRVEDNASKNGLFVNGERCQSHELRHGDLLGIGEFAIQYQQAGERPSPDPAAIKPAEAPIDLSSESDIAPAPRPPASELPAPPPPPPPVAERRVVPAGPPPVCPSCKQTLSAGDKICIPCGVDLTTGRRLRISHEVDEGRLYANADTIIYFAKLILPVNIMPIASDAYGRFKPYAMWAIAALTVVITVTVWTVNGASGQGNFGPAKNLMLWCGDQPNARLDFVAARNGVSLGEFHYYQLLTNAFLHGGLLHIAGNLIFLMIFGNRVNAVLGQWKAVAAYLLLAVASSSAFYWSQIGKPVIPELGASGAIMGMAGMYVVLMPTSRVYMVAWVWLGMLTAFRRFTKFFKVRGIWMLPLWIGFNDVLPTVLHSQGDVAHWAHLGGFLAGVVLALILLVARQVDANGADILSVLFGPSAWKFIGAPGAAASRQSVSVLQNAAL